jgi:uncharacterized protein YegL
MPKMNGISVTDINKTVHGFQYTSVTIDKLGATEYTLFSMIADETGSVFSFKAGLENMLAVSVDSCKKSPRAANLLMRQTAFSSRGSGSQIREIHGYSLLSSINPVDYKNCLSPNGGTPLIDAALEGVDAMYDMGKKLYKQKFLCNGILVILTDGEENASDPNHSAADIKQMIDRIKMENVLESVRTILIGVNDTDPRMKACLDSFKNDAGIDEYISMGDVTAGKLAKLAQFVSQSVSSQSQSLGSGTGSVPLSFTF